MRHDRMSCKVFKETLLLAKVTTVKKTANNTERPPDLQYSVVQEILKKLHP